MTTNQNQTFWSEPRYEVKFVADTLHASLFDVLIRCGQHCGVEHHPPRIINNIYFDTLRYHAFHETQEGLNIRQKLRIRWYGQTLNPKKMTLELKCRDGQLITKGSYSFEGFDLASIKNWAEFRRIIKERLTGEALIWFENFQTPTLYNQYHREYYLNPTHNIRITLDAQHKARDQHISPLPHFNFDRRLPDMKILEIKAPIDKLPQVQELCHKLPFPVQSFSKYAVSLGVMAY